MSILIAEDNVARKYYLLIFLLISALFCSSCAIQEVVSQTQNSSLEKNNVNEEKLLEEEILVYKDFQIIRQVKEEKDEETSKRLNKPVFEKHHYFFIKKDNKTLKIWDESGFMDSEIKLISFINKNTKQLWIKLYDSPSKFDVVITLENKPRVIFDSLNQNEGEMIGGEPIDIDNNNIYEFLENLDVLGCTYTSCAFRKFGTAIFKYNETEKKLMLANRQFSHFILKDLQRDKKILQKTIVRLNKETKKDSSQRIVLEEEHLSLVLKIVLDLVFSGKEKEAWMFYDRMCKLNDKEEIKKSLKKDIEGNDIYKLIYK